MSHSAKAAVFAGVLCWVLGFGMLNVLLWFSRKPSTNDTLPCLYDYYSATWGDGLLLPVAVAAASYALYRARTLAGRANLKMMVGCATVGFLIGGAYQALWLLDPNPHLNWMLPAPHHFSFAGWYHAAFLSIVSSCISLGAGEMFTLLNMIRSNAPNSASDLLRSRSLTIFLMAIFGFLALVIRDGMIEPLTQAQSSTWAGVVIAFLVLTIGLVIVGHGGLALVTGRLLSGALFAGAVLCLTYIDFRQWRVLVIAVVSVCAAMTLSRRAAHPSLWSITPIAGAAIIITSGVGVVAQLIPSHLGVQLVTIPVLLLLAYLFLVAGFGHLA
jgi:hypothetical protein